ncbi:MAG: response regulator [Nitrospirota bacterium]
MSKGKILVVDDEDIVLISCERTLTPAGYEVRMAKSGIDGLKMMENDGFNLALIDIKMPDMDGIEVLRQIKKKWPDTEVIIITGYSTLATAITSIKLGAYDYIEKPFTPDVLLSSVEKVLGQKE